MAELFALPVRIRIQVTASDQLVTFTCLMKFVVFPLHGDTILIDFDTRAIIRVESTIHFVCDTPSVMVVVNAIEVPNQEALLQLLDDFKSQFELTDFESNVEQPPPHYMLYRNVLRMLGLNRTKAPLLQNDQELIKLFVAACRTSLMAEVMGTDPTNDEITNAFESTKTAIETLHGIIIDKEKIHTDGIPICDIIKAWDTIINPGQRLKWAQSDAAYVAVGRLVFRRLATVKLPPFFEVAQ